MPTTRTRALVSIAAAVGVALALGACVRTPSPSALGGITPIEGSRSLAIRFDNNARDHVHVYLIGDRREWLLGRVEAGAIRTLTIPDGSLTGSARHVQLAVITGEGITHQAARHPRATFTGLQPVSSMLRYEWTFTQGHLSPVALR